MSALAWKNLGIAGTCRLEARRLPGERGAAVIAPPHPLYGGTLDNPVVLAIADGLRRAGAGALAFNWRGVEGSEGEATSSLEAAVEDYLAALRVLQDESPVYAAGYSFGAATALLAACAEPRVAGVVMVAPPAGMLRAEDLRTTRAGLLVVVGDDDAYAPLPALEEKLAARPDAVLEVLAGTDHFFHYGGHAEIAAKVAAHVARLPDAARAE